jgi:hypothetical protein
MLIQKCLLRQAHKGQWEELQRMFSAWGTKAFHDVELLCALAQRLEAMKGIFALVKYPICLSARRMALRFTDIVLTDQ